MGATIIRRTLPLLLTLALAFVPALQAQQKTALLPDAQLDAITAEASGSLAKDTIIVLGRLHRVQASPEFHEAASYIAQKAREYGLQDVAIESFPADGVTTYHTFKSYLGWEAEAGVLTDGNSAKVHHEAVEVRGAVGILSHRGNNVTGWSGDYPDIIPWGILSPYNTKNTFAFKISLRQGRAYQARLARGEQIRLQASVKARIKPGNFEVVTGIIPGTDPGAGEIVFSCHLCHQKPGANDNASGAATILEDARLLVTLIKQGKLPRPRRTIRFIWPPEIAGTICYFARHPDLVQQMRAAVHMDMVGGDYQITKAVFHLTRTPASLPSYVNDVAAVFGEYVIDGAVPTDAVLDYLKLLEKAGVVTLLRR